MSAADAGNSAGAPVLITGGAGFVGSNVAQHLLRQGSPVRVFDSLARPGSAANVHELRRRFPRQLEFVQGDVRDAAAVHAAMQDVVHVYHLAAQVAVTTSLIDPRGDFEVNAGGTLNVLEAARACRRPPSLLFASTNKVYGSLEDLELTPSNKRYALRGAGADDTQLNAGVSEMRSLDFHSPYGCSKGAAEQYVLDYARSYGLNTVVMRMSCIYGPHQNGTEDQGWVAHFMRAVMAGRPVTVFGTGMQVRDILYVGDLVNAFECARIDIDALRGRAFNMGGGFANSVSVLEVLDQIAALTGQECTIHFGDWRIGDQRYYVSDTAAFRQLTGWRARTAVGEGLASLHDWLAQQAGIVESAPPLAAAGRGL